MALKHASRKDTPVTAFDTQPNWAYSPCSKPHDGCLPLVESGPANCLSEKALYYKASCQLSFRLGTDIRLSLNRLSKRRELC